MMGKILSLQEGAACFNCLCKFFGATYCDCETDMEGEWDVNVLNCCYDATVCLIALVPCGYCWLSAQATATATTDDCQLWFACALCCLCLGGAFNRKAIRQKFGLEGSGVKDSCTHLWCGLCAVCQEYNFVHKAFKEGRLPQDTLT
jgi:Cys-rich protein (TIGR01571 family)